jgi:leader peptidase (prepilin peptidase)/N-methyltransferase
VRERGVDTAHGTGARTDAAPGTGTETEAEDAAGNVTAASTAVPAVGADDEADGQAKVETNVEAGGEANSQSNGEVATDTDPNPDPQWRPVVARWQLPIAVATVALLAGIVARLGVHWSTLPVLAFATTAVALTVIDFAILRLPNDLTFPTAGAVAATLVAQAVAEKNTHKLLTELEGSLAAAAFYLLLFVLSRGGLGLGDVKVGAIAGALLAARDWQHVLNGTFLAYIITLGVALVLLTRGRKKFPYGPGLLAGTIAVLLMG